MKSKIFKYVVLASALVFMNCGEDAKNALTNAVDDYKSQQSLVPMVDENGNPVLDENGNPIMIPDPNAQVQGYIPLVDENGNPVLDENGNQVMIQDTTQRDDPEGGLNIGSNTDDPKTDPNAQQPASSASVDPQQPASSASVDPNAQQVDPAVSSASVDPQQPASSASVDPQQPASSASVEPVVVEPASSASVEPVVSSSSVEVQAPKGIFLADGKEEEKDQMHVEYKQGTGPDGKSILSYPSELSNDQKHGIVVWGPGGGTEPAAYEGMIRRLASHGFVVIALRESPGDGHLATEALDWLAKENQNPSSPLNGKLDMNTVGCSGHSMGGLESEQAVIKDKRVLTAFMNNSGDWNGDGANHVPTDRSIAILYGEVGSEKNNAINDYNNQGVKAPACLIEMNGGPMNSEGGYGHGSGSWDGMAATVAWMRWHLGGETERKADFVGTSGKYINGSIVGHQGHWKTQCKNF